MSSPGPDLRLLRAAAAALALSVLAGCGTLSFVVRSEPTESQERGGRPQRRIMRTDSLRYRNNSHVRLIAGRYVGDLTVGANSVTFAGAGNDQTSIDGDVVIRGNNVVMRGLTITGDVLLAANNADLRGATILGRVAIRGNNNVW